MNINKISASLNHFFKWNKARMNCFVKMLFALFTVRTVNLQQLAQAFKSNASVESTCRRLRRFFKEVSINHDDVATFLFTSTSSSQKSFLVIDRTNWKFGKKSINIFMLSRLCNGAAMPIYYDMLNKEGSSNTSDRIRLLEKYIANFGKDSIAGILGDREFIGAKWFEYLKKEKIPFYIRIKNNTNTTDNNGVELKLEDLFMSLKISERKVLKVERFVWGQSVYLSGLRCKTGELLVVASSEKSTDALDIYALRWKIETLFGSLKTRGFRFEDTHITDPEKIKKLIALLAIGFSFAYQAGEWRSQYVKPIKIKKHRRRSVSIFRYGLDLIREILLGLKPIPIFILEAILQFLLPCNLCKPAPGALS